MMVKKFSVIGIAIILTSSLLIGITSALIKNDYFKSFDNTANEPNVIIKDKFLYYDGINITWFGTSCFQLKTSDLVIYIDPYRLTGDEEIADIVIATHDHYDHLSVKDIKLIADTRTTLYTPKPSQTDAYGTTVEELETLEVKEIYYTKPWDNIEINGITLDFVPAYTLSHLPEWNWTGVIIDFGNVRIYHAGDTNNN